VWLTQVPKYTRVRRQAEVARGSGAVGGGAAVAWREGEGDVTMAPFEVKVALQCSGW
jgi:hypothetical protein